MNVNEDTPTPLPHDTPVPRMTPDKLIETARRIVTGDLMVADLEDRDWQMSLCLLIGGMENRPPNLGLILVPQGPHLSGRWLNGRVPGVTMEAEFVAVEDTEALGAEYKRMWEALHPGEVSS
jgi:hypothetical protein